MISQETARALLIVARKYRDMLALRIDKGDASAGAAREFSHVVGLVRECEEEDRPAPRSMFDKQGNVR